MSAYGWLLEDVLNAPPLDERVLGGLRHRRQSTTWAAFVADGKPQDADDGTWHNAIVGELAPDAVPAWRAQYAGVADATALVTIDDLEAFKLWAPRVVRFSFLHSSHSAETDLSSSRPDESAQDSSPG